MSHHPPETCTPQNITNSRSGFSLPAHSVDRPGSTPSSMSFQEPAHAGYPSMQQSVHGFSGAQRPTQQLPTSRNSVSEQHPPPFSGGRPTQVPCPISPSSSGGIPGQQMYNNCAPPSMPRLNQLQPQSHAYSLSQQTASHTGIRPVQDQAMLGRASYPDSGNGQVPLHAPYVQQLPSNQGRQENSQPYHNPYPGSIPSRCGSQQQYQTPQPQHAAQSQYPVPPQGTPQHAPPTHQQPPHFYKGPASASPPCPSQQSHLASRQPPLTPVSAGPRHPSQLPGPPPQLPGPPPQLPGPPPQLPGPPPQLPGPPPQPPRTSAPLSQAPPRPGPSLPHLPPIIIPTHPVHTPPVSPSVHPKSGPSHVHLPPVHLSPIIPPLKHEESSQPFHPERTPPPAGRQTSQSSRSSSSAPLPSTPQPAQSSSQAVSSRGADSWDPKLVSEAILRPSFQSVQSFWDFIRNQVETAIATLNRNERDREARLRHEFAEREAQLRQEVQLWWDRASQYRSQGDEMKQRLGQVSKFVARGPPVVRQLIEERDAARKEILALKAQLNDVRGSATSTGTVTPAPFEVDVQNANASNDTLQAELDRSRNEFREVTEACTSAKTDVQVLMKTLETWRAVVKVRFDELVAEARNAQNAAGLRLPSTNEGSGENGAKVVQIKAEPVEMQIPELTSGTSSLQTSSSLALSAAGGVEIIDLTTPPSSPGSKHASLPLPTDPLPSSTPRSTPIAPIPDLGARDFGSPRFSCPPPPSSTSVLGKRERSAGPRMDTSSNPPSEDRPTKRFVSGPSSFREGGPTQVKPEPLDISMDDTTRPSPPSTSNNITAQEPAPPPAPSSLVLNSSFFAADSEDGVAGLANIRRALPVLYKPDQTDPQMIRCTMCDSADLNYTYVVPKDKHLDELINHAVVGHPVATTQLASFTKEEVDSLLLEHGVPL